jgi:polyhydroxyalkanoate synthesis regulator phasin
MTEYKNNNSKRKEGVLLEDLDSKLDLVLDGHKLLDRKIDGLGKELQEFKKDTKYKLDLIVKEIKEIKDKLDKVIYRPELEALEKRVEKLEETVRLVKGN